MRSLNKFSKTIDIKLVEEKYYFPGQTIKGFVNVHPKNPTRTNHIVVKFTGEVALSVKEKDALSLFQKTKIIQLAGDEEQTKCYIMEAKLHSFPFEFVVPDDIQLPSAMEVNKKVRIRYTLSALHDKPMVPESLCPKAEYPVHILEFIDINDDKYRIPQNKSSQVLLPLSKPMNLCGVWAFLPRCGFTRGDIVPLSLIIHHYEPFYLTQAIDITLIRTVEIRNGKNLQVKEDILKSTTCDIQITDPHHFSQTMKRQLLIPTSTPPSIDFKNNLLRIQYKVRICTRFIKLPPIEDKRSSYQQNGHCIVDIPIVIGTWPRASIPIDDDDDDDDAMTMEDADFIDVANNSVSGSESIIYHGDHSSIVSGDDRLRLSQQHIDRLRGTPTTESSSGNSSSSTIRPITKSTSPTTINNDSMTRSDSIASKSSSTSYASYASYQSNQSWGTSSASLSRNTSLSTTVSIPESCKSNTAIINNRPMPHSETIMASPTSPCFTNTNNNKYVSSVSSQHRGSDPTGAATIQSQQQYPVLVGPSPMKYQKHQSMIFPSQQHVSNGNSPSTIRFSTSNINLSGVSCPPTPTEPTNTRLPLSPSPSLYHHRRSSSSFWPSSNNKLPESSPVSLSPRFPQSPTMSNAILLQPITNNHTKTTSALAPTKTIHVPPHDELDTRHTVHQDLNTNDDDDNDDDDDDEEDDFLTIVKRKQEQALLEESTRLHMTEMKI
ncbi:hypothetical protein [Absidia glauca]|uniref:Arrestin C-terminal-like domain-containing protein n=1 Tax=Absidia glauca TaxID=4829 RepID=A0A168N713_ABSGL|nr:hypothetical protein [Absidia glauca]